MIPDQNSFPSWQAKHTSSSFNFGIGITSNTFRVHNSILADSSGTISETSRWWQGANIWWIFALNFSLSIWSSQPFGSQDDPSTHGIVASKWINASMWLLRYWTTSMRQWRACQMEPSGTWNWTKQNTSETWETTSGYQTTKHKAVSTWKSCINWNYPESKWKWRRNRSKTTTGTILINLTPLGVAAVSKFIAFPVSRVSTLNTGRPLSQMWHRCSHQLHAIETWLVRVSTFLALTHFHDDSTMFLNMSGVTCEWGRPWFAKPQMILNTFDS